MKRKLKINRETLRNLVDESLQEAAGGNASTILTRCGSCNATCNASCIATCTIKYSVCVVCQF
jgi:hypothetical protein